MFETRQGLLKEFLIYVKPRSEHFTYQWISSCVFEARTETVACVHGSFGKNQTWRYFSPKNDWKFEGSISFRWRDIQKTMCVQSIAVIENVFKVFSFRRREKNWGPDFKVDWKRRSEYTAKIFWQKSFKFEGLGMLRYGDISMWKMHFLLTLIEKFPNFQIISITEIRFHKLFSYIRILHIEPYMRHYTRLYDDDIIGGPMTISTL